MSGAARGAAGARGTFGARLAAATGSLGPLCVGIDPHPALLTAWGLRDDADGLRRFAMTVMEALDGHVAALKPQVAFFERHGSRGVAVLEEVLRHAGGITQMVVDAKRGDIGSSMAGYADAFLREGAPLACDALTVSPYLGFGSLTPAVEVARAAGRGLFVLALTSNPEGGAVQHAVPPGGGTSVAAEVAAEAARLNAAELVGRSDGLGSVGLVVGATTGTAARRHGVDLAAVRGPLLAPGVGAQGGGRAELAEVFGGVSTGVLPSTSRAVLAAGPRVADLRAAAGAALDEARAALEPF